MISEMFNFDSKLDKLILSFFILGFLIGFGAPLISDTFFGIRVRLFSILLFSLVFFCSGFKSLKGFTLGIKKETNIIYTIISFGGGALAALITLIRIVTDFLKIQW